MNLFALVKEHNQTVIKRIPLSQDIQVAISNFYSDGVNDLIVNKELINRHFVRAIMPVICQRT